MFPVTCEYIAYCHFGYLYGEFVLSPFVNAGDASYW